MAQTIREFATEARKRCLQWLESEYDGNSPTQTHRQVMLVCGNESADLDSVVSALLWAYFVDITEGDKWMAIPVIRVSRKDYALRGDARRALRMMGIEDILDKGMIFADDLQARVGALRTHVNAATDRGGIEVVLVDHNEWPTPSVSKDSWMDVLHPCVAHIVDHHQDKGQFLAQCHTRRIDAVGSCCTLIANSMLSAWDKEQTKAKFSEEKERNEKRGAQHDVEWRCWALLQLVILVDTVNLDKTKQRVTAQDEDAVKRLAEVLRPMKATIKGNDKSNNMEEEWWNMTAIAAFEAVVAAKNDVSQFRAADLLRRDFKHKTFDGNVSVGFASVPISMENWMQQEWKLQTSESNGSADAERWTPQQVLFATWDEFCSDLHLDVLILNTAFMNSDGQFQRELGLVLGNSQPRSRRAFATCRQAFVDGGGDVDLGVTELTSRTPKDSVAPDLYCWTQRNTAASRKAITALLSSVFKSS